MGWLFFKLYINSQNTHVCTTVPITLYMFRRYSPRPHMTTDPFESPDKTSPFCVNAKHVTYLGRSRVVSNIPLRLYRVPPASSVQKLMWPLPQVTIWLRSNGWNSAATTVSIEHCTNRYCYLMQFHIRTRNIQLHHTEHYYCSGKYTSRNEILFLKSAFFIMLIIFNMIPLTLVSVILWPFSFFCQSHTDMLWSFPSSMAHKRLPPSCISKTKMCV